MSTRKWQELFYRFACPGPAHEKRSDSSKAEPDFFALSLGNCTLGNLSRDASYSLHVSLFDAANGLLFGKPWHSAKPISGHNRLAFDERLLLATSLETSEVYAVVEVVCELGEDSGDGYEQPAGGSGTRRPNFRQVAGWAPLPLAASNRKLDIYNGCAAIAVAWASRKQTGESIELICQKLLKTVGSIDVTLGKHSPLGAVRDHLLEHCWLDQNLHLPSIQSASKSEPSLCRPRALPPISLSLLSPSVDVPPTFESDMCTLIDRERLLRENRSASGAAGGSQGERLVVVERRLTVGVHNGLSYLSAPSTYVLLSENGKHFLGGATGTMRRRVHAGGHARTSSLDGQGALAGQSSYRVGQRIELSEFIDSPGVAVVFTLEMMLAVESDLPPNRDPPTYTVCAAWGVWQRPPDVDSGDAYVALFGGPARAPDGSLCFKSIYRIITNNDKTAKTLPSANVRFQFALNYDGSTQYAAIGAGDWAVSRRGSDPSRGSPATQRADAAAGNQSRDTVDAADAQLKITVTPPPPPPKEGRPSLRETMRKKRFLEGDDETLQGTIEAPVWRAQDIEPSGIVDHDRPLDGSRMVEERQRDKSEREIMQPWPTSVGLIDRRILAVLASADYAPLSDRHGDEPLSVPPTANVNLALHDAVQRELHDPLDCNEFFIQFLAVSSETGAAMPARLFFTYRFYRFPELATERLMLARSAPALRGLDVRVLRRLDADGRSMPDAHAGFLASHRIDSTATQVSGERELFARYLLTGTLHIHCWDADSLMCLGAAAVPLRVWDCPQGREAVQCYISTPLVATQVRGGQQLAVGAGLSVKSRASVRGSVLIRLANVGFLTPNLGDYAAPESTSLNRPIVSQRLSRTVGRVHARPLAHPQRIAVTHPNRLDVTLDDGGTTLSEEARRKMDRLRHVQEFARSTIRALRAEHKRRALAAQCYSQVTATHTVHPSLGSTEFFEYLLRNDEESVVMVQVDVQDEWQALRPVTDTREWAYFKRLHRLDTPIHEDLFTTVPENDHNQNEISDKRRPTYQIALAANESVYIPFKYTMLCGHYNASALSLGTERAEKGPAPSLMIDEFLMRSRTVQVAFSRISPPTAGHGRNLSLCAVLLLQIEPRPHPVHHVCRFYADEGSFLERTVRLGHGRYESVACSDPSVICELRRRAPSREAYDVYFKVPVGKAPNVRALHLLLYERDRRHAAALLAQMYVHAARRLDAVATEGTTVRVRLSLGDGGGAASSLCRLYASSNELHFEAPHGAPFALSKTEDAVAILTPQPGLDGEIAATRVYQINLVDSSERSLIMCWLLYAYVSPAAVSKSYAVVIGHMERDKTFNKDSAHTLLSAEYMSHHLLRLYIKKTQRIAYTNRYNVEKALAVSSSRPNLVTVRDSYLGLEPAGTGVISIKVHPSQMTPDAHNDVYLFLNDAQGRCEDVLKLRLSFSE